MSGCADLADTRVELALGLLSGTDRAAAVSHLATCRTCREEVDDLSRVVDQLSLLAPQAEPPSGFETRVLAAVAGGRVGRGRVGRRRPLPYAFRAGRLIGGRAAAVVAVGLVAMGLVLGFAADRTGDRPPTEEANVVAPVRTALAVSPSGRTTCRVVITGSNPATVVVSLDGSPGASGAYAVAMQQVGGPTIDLGTLQLTDGHGVLARSVPVDAALLTTMVMYGEDGKVLYQAPLTNQVVTPQPRPRVDS
jgi:anti-sigma factor RsiW